MYIPDNADLYNYYEREQARRERLYRRQEIEEELEREEDFEWETN